MMLRSGGEKKKEGHGRRWVAEAEERTPGGETMIAKVMRLDQIEVSLSVGAPLI